MKSLILLQGPPGSGKSTFIKEHGLKDYTVCPDDIRLLLSAPVLKGTSLNLNSKNDKMVWDMTMSIVEKRMQQGSFTVVDATHNNEKSVNQYKALAKKYGYRVYIIKFDVSLETLLTRNEERKGTIKYVGEADITRHYENIQKFQYSSWYTLITPSDFKSMVGQRIEKIDVPVVHIGDIHGCYSALSQLKYDPNKHYVFMGDYFDRGIENGEVAKMLIEWSKYPNVTFLYGNHERHLTRYFETGEFGTHKFKQSMQEIHDAGVTDAELKLFLRKLVYVFYYEHKGKKVLCTHAGLPFMPEELRFLNPSDFYVADGDYELDVDKLFCPEDKSIYQVHGHRNHYGYSAHAGKQSFNLNTAIEGGEPLRVLTLDDDFTLEEFACTKYNPEYAPDAGPYWSMYRDKDIVKKEFGDVIAFNFSKETFWDKRWTANTTMARGMFCSKSTQEVLARGYEKFFTFKENSITSEESIKNLKYPLTAYQKENGYLGLLGIQNGELLFCSKSSPESDFSTWFKDIFNETVKDVEGVRDYLVKHNACMAFEVIDATNDPHIIQYDSSKIVLLDVFDRSFKFNRLPYKELQDVAKTFGLNVKKKETVLNSYEEFLKFAESVGQYEYEVNGEKVEGYVLEDSSSEVFHFKLKTGFYKFWKVIRNGIERNQMETIQKVIQNMVYSDLNDYKAKALAVVRKYNNAENKPSLFEMEKWSDV